jgi:hypothetical protein
MKLSYFCPHCRGLLNPGTKVIFVIEHGSDRGLLLLSPELGDYAVVLAESFPIESGTRNDFSCPICHHDLTSPANHNLVEILCRQPDGSDARVNFSRVAGEHATFVCGPRGIRSFGEHAPLYEGVNFFGEGDLTRRTDR